MTPIVRAGVIVAMLPASFAAGCDGPSEVASKSANDRKAPVPPEVRCELIRTADGRGIVRYKVRNVGHEVVHILDGRRMPYTIAHDAKTLLILHGVHRPIPAGALYEMVERPPTRPLAPGAIFTGEVEVAAKSLHNHNAGGPTPTSLMHGTIQVLCQVGWGSTPITEAMRPSLSFGQLMAWQRLSTYGPFSVVLP